MHDANDDKKKLRSLALRTLLRAGGPMREGVWGNQLKLRISEPEFQSFLDGLKVEGLVAVAPTGFGKNCRVSLTETGRAEAIRLVQELAAETYGYATAAE